jgi:hypothetical protein
LRGIGFGLLTAVLLAVGAAHASAWPREKGRLFLSTKSNYFTAQADAPLPGAIDPPRYERVDGDIYVEYGLFKDLTLGGKVIYGYATFFDGFKSESVNGVAEAEASVQYTIFRNRVDSFGVRLTGATPTRFENGGRPGVFSDGFDAELRAIYGRTLFARPFKAYAEIGAGYRRRFGEGADQIRADALLGVEPFRRMLLLLEAQSKISMRNEDFGGANYDVIVFQPSAVWRMTRRFALQAGFTWEAAGRNLDLGQGYFLSLWTEF